MAARLNPRYEFEFFLDGHPSLSDLAISLPGNRNITQGMEASGNSTGVDPELGGYVIEMSGTSSGLKYPNSSSWQQVGDFSVLVRYRSDVYDTSIQSVYTISGDGGALGENETHNTLGRVYSNASGSENTHKYAHEYDAGVNQVSSGFILTKNVWTNLVVTRDSVKKQILIFDRGDLRTTYNYTNNPTVTGTDTRLGIGGNPLAAGDTLNQLLTGAVSIVGFSHRKWEYEEARQLSRNPLLAWAPRRIWIPVGEAAAGGETTADIPTRNINLAMQAPKTLRSLISHVPTL